jgi:HAD superfamily hydrolase (TIGR01459 family)
MIYKNILDISKNYKSFIIDVWGVLHASGIPFEGVFKSLEALQENGKHVILVSNAPRRSSKVESFLKDTVGVIRGKHYNDILTSGETFFIKMGEYKLKKVFYIGPEKDMDILKDLHNFSLTKNLTESFDFAVITGIESSFEETLQLLREENKVLYCLNPDIFITKSDGSTEECAGFIAKKYQNIGGEVIYFGKPYDLIYNMAYKKLQLLNPALQKNEILGIGDGMETDILGASNFEIDSCLCLAGLPSKELEKGVSLDEFLSSFEAKPNFMIEKL